MLVFFYSHFGLPAPKVPLRVESEFGNSKFTLPKMFRNVTEKISCASFCLSTFKSKAEQLRDTCEETASACMPASNARYAIFWCPSKL